MKIKFYITAVTLYFVTYLSSVLSFGDIRDVRRSGRRGVVCGVGQVRVMAAVAPGRSGGGGWFRRTRHPRLEEGRIAHLPLIMGRNGSVGARHMAGLRPPVHLL